MSLAVLELIQKDDGEIVLQADGGSEPLLQLRFSFELTQMLGADALALAQAMVEAASDTLDYASDCLAQDGPGDGLSSDDPTSVEPIIRLQTSPLH